MTLQLAVNYGVVGFPATLIFVLALDVIVEESSHSTEKLGKIMAEIVNTHNATPEMVLLSKYLKDIEDISIHNLTILHTRL
jgi:hypothetical protein